MNLRQNRFGAGSSISQTLPLRSEILTPENVIKSPYRITLLGMVYHLMPLGESFEDSRPKKGLDPVRLQFLLKGYLYVDTLIEIALGFSHPGRKDSLPVADRQKTTTLPDNFRSLRYRASEKVKQMELISSSTYHCYQHGEIFSAVHLVQ
ncbi:LOW QUALITY PROTEIN: hypothetical protein PHMEG_00028774 [Phytophthora megakarya]|uniref:Uncharacterized protein n=1 Tax=Phytophthora megakarya TaxID=4795 RepID=A0A225V6S1_9STRA|nr:LOW QUALITY PROTEIN: hypothetical protein PHMEG_00028774 [Phytophthora megakarya]